MKKRLFISLMVVVLTVIALPFNTEEVQANSESANFTGSACTSDDNAAAKIDYVKSEYKHMSRYNGPGQCWGYAEKVREMLASSSSTKYYTGLKNTASNFKKKCLGIKAGSHIRFSHGSSFNGWSGHSVALLKVSKDQVIWADNNYYRSNIVSYYKGSMNDFMKCYGQYGYINMVSETTKFKTYTTPKLSVTANHSAGKIKLTWLASTGAERYEVYRSYSKKGDYTKIAESAFTNYVDDSVKRGVKVYYKVKAVKNNQSKYGNVESISLKDK